MRVLLLCTVVFGALETGPLLSFSGSFDSNTTFTGNYIYSDGSCSSSSSYSYQSINYTFSTAGVRTINSYNIDYVGVANNGVAVNLTDLCNSSVFPLRKGTYSISAIYPFGHWFDANVPYTFILGGSSTEKFVVEVWNGIQGQTALNTAAVGVNKTWSPLIISSNNDCSQDPTPQLYDTQVVTINASGVYNVFLAFAQNLTLPQSIPYGDPRFTIIQGDVSGMDLSTANCTNVMFVTASEDNSNVNAQKFFVSLTGNQTYTFVISSGYFYADSFYYGHYSLTVSPATRLSFSSLQTWTPPTTSSCPSTTACQSSTRSSMPFGLATFKVVANSYFFVHATEYQTANGSYYGSADLRFFLFAGVNTGPLTCGGLSTCVDTADGFSSQIYTATSNTDYTLIVQDYYDRTLLGSDVSSDLYVMSGLQLGQTAVTNAPSSMPSSAAPSSMGGGTAAPSSMGGGTAAPSSMGGGTAAPSSSRQPTAKGFTYAPSTIAPTPVGYTYAPSSVKPQNATVNSGVRLHPGFLALALVACGLM